MELNETELLQILKKQCFTPEDVAYFLTDYVKSNCENPKLKQFLTDNCV
jgi:hypothetical protein